MKKLITAFVILLTLISCVAKYPKEIVGVTLGCATDSTPVVVDTIVRFKAVIQTKSNPQLNDIHYKFMECDNKPDSLELYPFYPTQLILDFKERKYTYTFSLKQVYYTNCDKGFCVRLNFDSGKLDYSAKKRTITLTSTMNNWTRTFKYSYNKQDKVLTLTSKAVK